VSSAKADFLDETGALADSVQSLSSSVEALPASPTAKQLAPVALEISSTVNAAQALLTPPIPHATDGFPEPEVDIA
jgi:hypothetical protein